MEVDFEISVKVDGEDIFLRELKLSDSDRATLFSALHGAIENIHKTMHKELCEYFGVK